MGIFPTSGGYGGDGFTGGVILRLLPPEHTHTVHCCQGHYGPVPGSGGTSGFTDVQAVVGSVSTLLVGDMDNSSGGGTGGGGGGVSILEHRQGGVE